MEFNPNLNPGDVLSNDQVVELFKCSPQGGMRRALKTNSLVIVSDHTRGIYEDRWIGDKLHYTGMGLEGDQQIGSTQNKTLAESTTNGVNVFLFEVFETGKYTYQGQVHLSESPYQEVQPDANGKARRVWIFPLALSQGTAPAPLPEKILLKNRASRERQARKLSDQELENRVKYSVRKPGSRQVSTSTFDRNSDVAELAKRKSKGNCQLCGLPAPFIDKSGEPFLESHHINWLSKGGEDSIENTVALCPNFLK